MKVVLPIDAESLSASDPKTAFVENAISFDALGDGKFAAIVPIAFHKGDSQEATNLTVRNTRITITAQTQATTNGTVRAMFKVDLPYSSIDADGVFSTKGSVSAHMVLTLPRQAVRDLLGDNGIDASTAALRQQGLVRYLLGLLDGTLTQFSAPVDEVKYVQAVPGTFDAENDTVVATGGSPEQEESMNRRFYYRPNSLVPITAAGEKSAVLMPARLVGDNSDIRTQAGIPSGPILDIDLSASKDGDQRIGPQDMGPNSRLGRILAGVSPISSMDEILPKWVSRGSSGFVFPNEKEAREAGYHFGCAC